MCPGRRRAQQETALVHKQEKLSTEQLRAPGDLQESGEGSGPVLAVGLLGTKTLKQMARFKTQLCDPSTSYVISSAKWEW